MSIQQIDQEVRIRMLENITIKIDENLKELRLEMKSQFRWTTGLIFGFIGVVILPVIASELIGLIKLIRAL